MLKRYCHFFGLLTLAILYSWTLPEWPQVGDSTEIVLRGWTWGAIHAPGYPLATLYYSLSKFLPFSNPVTSAALLTTLPALGALVIIFRAWGEETSQSLRTLLTVFLGTQPLFWTYAVTPEVFSIHLLFVAVFLEFALRPERYLSKTWTGLAALSVLHHHTIIFLAPVVLRAAILHRRHRGAHVFAVVAGLGALSGYLLLFAFDTSDAWSWYEFNTISDVGRHFLRSDYGTFRLAATGAAASTLERITSFIDFLFFAGLSIVLLVAWNYRRVKDTPQLPALQLLFSLTGIYVLSFSFLSGLDPEGIDQETWKRFSLMPLTLLVFSFGKILLHLPKNSTRIVISLVLLQTMHQTYQFIGHVESGVRDVPAKHNLQLLTTLPKDSVLLTVGDSAFFMTGHWQEVMGIRRDVRIFPATAHPNFLTKLIRRNSDIFTISVPDGPWLYQIDFTRHPVFAMHGVSFQARGRFPLSLRYQNHRLQLLKGASPLALDCASDVSAYPGHTSPFDAITEAGIIGLQYGSCELYQALVALRSGRPDEALAFVQEGLLRNPFNFQLKNLRCDLVKTLRPEESAGCGNDLDHELTKVHPFYLAQPLRLPPDATIPD
ncbi:MAG: hypothetical protein ACLGG7_10580 [Bacteriovoracia bacterium]